jgi:hypothetical protein
MVSRDTWLYRIIKPTPLHSHKSPMTSPLLVVTVSSGALEPLPSHLWRRGSPSRADRVVLGVWTLGPIDSCVRCKTLSALKVAAATWRCGDSSCTPRRPARRIATSPPQLHCCPPQRLQPPNYLHIPRANSLDCSPWPTSTGGLSTSTRSTPTAPPTST